MKEFAFRFNIKDNFNFALRFINLLNALKVDYDYYLEDIGTEVEVTGLLLVIVINLKSDFDNVEVPL